MTPKISIGIPLYKAAQHFENVVRSIEAIDRPDVEILISDRHDHDDTLARLEARFMDDDRVQCYRHQDGRGWLDNYNFLLSAATGEYFTWLPQDDSPPVPLDALVAHLDQNPSVILAYPAIEVMDREGRPLWVGRHDLKVAAGRRPGWGFGDALSVAARLRHHAAGKGLFRLDVVRSDGLELRPVTGELFATNAFRFGLACRGSLEMVPSAVAGYRLHGGNLTTRVGSARGRYLSYFRAARQFHPDTPGLNRLGRDVALFGATVLIAPTLVLWRLTRRGRRSWRANNA